MPEYLAPGVYVEETSFRSKSIEGVSTTTTGFIGPCRYGPLDIEPDIITSLGEFERTYGDRQKLIYEGQEMDNYLWHAARAFFEEGGKRLYVARVFQPSGTNDGRATAMVPDGGAAADSLLVQARFPGAAGNLRVRFTLRLGQNVLTREFEQQGTNKVFVSKVKSLLNNDVVWMGDIQSPLQSPLLSSDFHLAVFDPATSTWSFEPGDGGPTTPAILLSELRPAEGDRIHVVTVTVTVESTDEFGSSQVWADLPLDPNHLRSGAPDSLSEKFAPEPTNRAQARTLPIIITLGDNLDSGLKVLDALFQAKSDLREACSWRIPNRQTPSARMSSLSPAAMTAPAPIARHMRAAMSRIQRSKTGLKAFEDIEDISIVAAPGSTFRYESDDYGIHAAAIVSLLIAHAARMRYRIAVLDSGDGQTISQVRAMRGRFDSTYAALYYPWVRIVDPVTRKEIHLPPSGFVAGIYARSDINRAVYKAPANEVVNLAVGFEQLLNKSQQDVLNPEGINCFRFFEGRGFRLWGARTISSDPEWKYVNLRRYFAYLERSIDKGTQWAVFEPNGEQLWANVRRTIEDFLLDEWASGALLGDKPEKAYFVKCDRSTMTQNDLDNGRLVCLIGVAPLRPAEFVIFRIGQWTADRKA